MSKDSGGAIDNSMAQRRAAASLRTRVNGTDKAGYVKQPADNLLPGVTLEQFESDLREGDGNELRMKFCAAHSSAALAVNSFAPFKDRPETLSILGRHGAKALRFEKQLPIVPGRRPANIDVWIELDSEIVAVESKLLEYLRPTAPEFAPSYESMRSLCSDTGWWSCYEDAKQGQKQFLDRAQLIKHSFGLWRFQDSQRPARRLTLLYLFWEPSNASEFETFRHHRHEVESFAKAVGGSPIEFAWMTYPELWKDWAKVPALAQHTANLRVRYEVAI